MPAWEERTEWRVKMHCSNTKQRGDGFEAFCTSKLQGGLRTVLQSFVSTLKTKSIKIKKKIKSLAPSSLAEVWPYSKCKDDLQKRQTLVQMTLMSEKSPDTFAGWSLS